MDRSYDLDLFEISMKKNKKTGAKAAADARAALSLSAPSPPLKPASSAPSAPLAISQEAIISLERELDQGASIQALRRFNDNLRALASLEGGRDVWRPRLKKVMHLLAHNLESFNPAFAACVLQVQLSIGATDYEKRDAALKLLTRPLAGEYGMHAAAAAQGPTHRELFQAFYEDLLKEPLAAALAADAAPAVSADLLDRMMRDILGEGAERALSEGGEADRKAAADAVDRAAYALGYNLAIEYLADYEKTWMLDSFRALDGALGLGLGEWAFLEVHAEGEAEHAAIGHAATAALVDAPRAFLLRAAMRDHDADFAGFYNALADVLEQ